MDRLPPSSAHQSHTLPGGLSLDGGGVLDPAVVAYRTYGALNAERSNAVLVCHALTGDQYVAERHPLTGKAGWWSDVVGPGCAVDTDRLFVICANVIGGCMGSSGPSSLGEGGRPWGPRFPAVTIGDMVRAEAALVSALGIDRLFAVIGGSMGGMRVLQWMSAYPERVFAALPIATAPSHSAQNIALNEVGRQAVMADPEWQGGEYLTAGTTPARGLAVARMMAHITYLSEEALHARFGRRVRRVAEDSTRDADDVFEVESYLHHQGSRFVTRFDANSYVTITRAMDRFDLAADHGGDLMQAFKGVSARVCLVSFSSDWLYPTSASRATARALSLAGANVSFVEIETARGHDAFLLEEPAFLRTVSGFLGGCLVRAGLA